MFGVGDIMMLKIRHEHAECCLRRWLYAAVYLRYA